MGTKAYIAYWICSACIDFLLFKGIEKVAAPHK